MNAAQQRPAGTAQPSVASTKTGWAAQQDRRRLATSCHHCGESLANCLGCGDPRCPTCEPYLSDDCRWLI